MVILFIILPNYSFSLLIIMKLVAGFFIFSFKLTNFLRYLVFSFYNLTVTQYNLRFYYLRVITSLWKSLIFMLVRTISSFISFESTLAAILIYQEKDSATILETFFEKSKLKPLNARLCIIWLFMFSFEESRSSNFRRCINESSKCSREVVWLQLRISLSPLAGRFDGIYRSREGLLEFSFNQESRRVCVLSLSMKIVDAEEIEFRQLPICRNVGRDSLTYGGRNRCSVGMFAIQYQDYQLNYRSKRANLQDSLHRVLLKRSDLTRYARNTRDPLLCRFASYRRACKDEKFMVEAPRMAKIGGDRNSLGQNNKDSGNGGQDGRRGPISEQAAITSDHVEINIFIDRVTNQLEKQIQTQVDVYRQFETLGEEIDDNDYYETRDCPSPMATHNAEFKREFIRNYDYLKTINDR